MIGQPPGQLRQSVTVPGFSAPPELVHMIAVGQPAGQPELSYLVVSVGQWADHRNGLVDLTPVRQPASQLTTRVVIPCLSIVAKFINAVVLSQHVRPPP